LSLSFANPAQLEPGGQWEASREASIITVLFKSRCRIFVTMPVRGILIESRIAAKISGHPFVSIDALIFARLAITLSGWEFLQLFGVGREYQLARGAKTGSGHDRYG